MLKFLDEVETETYSGDFLYFPQQMPTSEIDSIISDIPSLSDMTQEIGELIGGSSGSVLIWSNQYKCLIQPPFPVVEKRISNSCDLQPLRTMLNQEKILALILVRLGDYAIGVFEGEKRISSKVGTGLVHSRHKKGGSSQRRFERHREKQMEYLFDRVCGHAREQMDEYSRTLDHLIYGGDSNTLRSFRKQCSYLKQFDERTLTRKLNVRKPRQKSLEAAIVDVWSSDLFEWFEPE